MKKVQLLLLCGAVILLAGCGEPNYSKIETELTKEVKSYYKENLEGKVIGINSHKITLAALKASGVNIDNFTKLDCEETSYALVNLTLDENKEVTSYEVENHLICGDYKTSNK
ncbi:MAG: hypothetical protein PHQ89_03155 [Bacilli bacterium]|nr:hypothetical protein [Bacilli bacterium]